MGQLSGIDLRQAISTPDLVLDEEAFARVTRAVARRLAGEPVHRILGYRDFYGLRLRLSSETLEPRPDTETLVELVLPFVRLIAARRGGVRLLDLGTGSGAIALALLEAVASARAVAADISPGALETAACNADILGLGERFDPKLSDWFDRIEGRFDVIVSNPPYIPTGDLAGLDVEVREHDPNLALDGGTDGLDAYRRIARDAGAHIAEGGRVAVEIGHDQRDGVTKLFASHGLELVGCAQDLAGHDRALMFA